MLAFYIAVGILGADDQMAQYSFFMLDVKDDTIQDQILFINKKHFKKHMLEELYHFRLLMGIYGHHDRIRYRQMLLGNQVHSQEIDLNNNEQILDMNDNNVDFAKDMEAINSFKWVFKQKDPSIAQFAKSLGNFNELIRKFLIEG